MEPFPRIVLLGDSITQLSFSPSLCGFGAHLADVYQRRADVLNRGFAGYNTDWILEYLSTPIGKQHIFGTEIDGQVTKLITIFFGANDASHEVLNPRHHVPLENYKNNIKSIHSIAKESCPNAKIIIICPPPVHHESRLRFQIEKWGEKATGELERTLEISGSYADAAQEVAKDLDVPFLNLWKEMQAERKDDWGEFLSDGLHLSKEGNKFVGNRLVDLIQDAFPDLTVIPCPFTNNYGNSGSKSVALEGFAPWHDEIEHTNPKQAFLDKCFN